MKSVVISKDIDVLTGLRLAGIEGLYCKNNDELIKNFRVSKSNKNLGLVILTEDDFNSIKDEVIEQKLSKSLPLVVTIPGKNGLKDKDFLLKYVRESVGV